MHRIIVCEVTQILRFKMCTIPISINLDAHITNRKSFANNCLMICM